MLIDVGLHAVYLSTMDQTRTGPDRWTFGGLLFIAGVAAVMSFAAWSGLAAQVGMVQTAGPVRLGWLLPLAVDTYAMIATRVWVTDRTVSDQTRTLARRTALGAIGLSFAGNALFHLVTVLDLQARPWWWAVVVLVTGLPAVLFGQAVHLHVRMRHDRTADRATAEDRTVPLISAEPVVSRPVGPAAPTITGPIAPVRPAKSDQTGLRVEQMRTAWPDRMPTKREVMKLFETRSTSTAVDLMRRHRTWLAGRADQTEPDQTTDTPTLRAVTND
jgi:hypothetical protein